MDRSFIKLNNTLAEALSLGDYKTTQIAYHFSVQLSPTESYLQITNNATGVVFNGTYKVETIDRDGKVLDDVTPNVFIEQYTDSKGVTQCAIEYINLTVDYHGRAVMLKLTNTTNNNSYYSNPLKITNKNIEKTIRFDYKNFNSLEGIDYQIVPYYQSIRIFCEYVGVIDNSEVGEYFQISTGNTISNRLLEKTAHDYVLERIDLQTYTALKKTFAHDEIYIDNIRVSNNPLIKENGRVGKTNQFGASFNLYRNESDIYVYDYQIFSGGLSLVSTQVAMDSVYTTCTVDPNLEMNFNVPVELGVGTIKIYDALGSLPITPLVTYTEADMTIVSNQLSIPNVFGDGNDIPSIGSYYILVSPGLVSAIGIPYVGIVNDTEWSFVFSVGQYQGTNYDNNEYLVDCLNPLTSNLSLFYKFNELSGTTALDSSVNSNEGTLTQGVAGQGTPELNQLGVIDKGYRFNYNGAYGQSVNVPSSSQLSFGADPFSIEIWLYPFQSFGRPLNKFYENTGQGEYKMIYQSGWMTFYAYTDSGNYLVCGDNGNTVTNAWNQIFITYDGSGDASGLKMRINDVAASESSSEQGNYTGMPLTSYFLKIGDQNGGLTNNKFQGNMDILRIWKGYEVTEAEITALYNGGAGTES